MKITVIECNLNENKILKTKFQRFSISSFSLLQGKFQEGYH